MLQENLIHALFIAVVQPSSTPRSGRTALGLPCSAVVGPAPSSCCLLSVETPGGKRLAERMAEVLLMLFSVSLTSQVCQGCHNAIDPEVQRVTYNSFSWHASTECFLCSCCSKCLIGQKFMPVEGMVFCSVECKKRMS